MVSCLWWQQRRAGWSMCRTRWHQCWTIPRLSGLAALCMSRSTLTMWTSWGNSSVLQRTPWQVEELCHKGWQLCFEGVDVLESTPGRMLESLLYTNNLLIFDMTWFLMSGYRKRSGRHVCHWTITRQCVETRQKTLQLHVTLFICNMSIVSASPHVQRKYLWFPTDTVESFNWQTTVWIWSVSEGRPVMNR